MVKLGTIRTIAHMTLLEATRGNIIRVLAVITASIMLANISFTRLFSWSLGKVSVEFGLSISALTGLLIVFFLVLRLLYNDLENKTIYFLFSRPIGAAEYLIGKYLGFAVLLLMTVTIVACGSFLSVHYIIWQYPLYISPLFSWGTFFLAYAYQLLGLWVMLAIAVFWFSFMTESFVALILSLFTYQIGQNMDLIRSLFVESFQESRADKVSAKAGLFITYLLPNLNLFDLKSHAAYGLPLSPESLFLIALYGLSYISILLVLATYSFGKRKIL